MLYGGAFSDGVIQVAATVAAGVLIAAFVTAVRFTMHVRDSVTRQDKDIKEVAQAVNHVPAGEPRLYDLVMEGVQNSVESIRQIKVLKGDLVQHRRQTEERLAVAQTRTDRRMDELQGVVLDLRDKVEALTPPDRPPVI